MPTTMTARYASRCIACGGEILPGMSMIHEGRRRSRHADAAACGADNGPDDYSNVNPVTGERMSNAAAVSVITFASGESITRNRRGTCEDAPCCGCCTF